jgi:lincosamide nucleotidyltransferase A/C/D/E
VEAEQVLAVLDALADAGCRAWVAGGWGVDALVGRQTRPHRDLDLALTAPHEPAALDALEALGFSVETDWRPIRVELAAAGARRVDLHPVVFDAAGHGHQADLDGGHFDYPRDAFAHGSIAGRTVACLSLQQQVRFHTGYEPREVDPHDIALLHRLATALGT